MSGWGRDQRRATLGCGRSGSGGEAVLTAEKRGGAGIPGGLVVGHGGTAARPAAAVVKIGSLMA